MAGRQEYEKVYLSALILAIVILAFNLYYYGRPFLSQLGWTSGAIDYLELHLRKAGIYSSHFKTKGIVVLLLFLSTIVKSGKGKNVPWSVIGSVGAVSGLLFFFPFRRAGLYLFATLSGFCGIMWTFAMISRRLSHFNEAVNDDAETFEK